MYIVITIFIGLISGLLSVHFGAFKPFSIHASIRAVYFISFCRLY